MARETWVQSQVESYQGLKMVLNAPLLNTQHYKLRIKGKFERNIYIYIYIYAVKAEKSVTFSDDFTHKTSDNLFNVKLKNRILDQPRTTNVKL